MSKFKDKILNSAIPGYLNKFQITLINEIVIDTLDSGKSISMECSRSTGGCCVGIAYASYLLDETENGYIVVYTNNDKDGLVYRNLLFRYMKFNNLKDERYVKDRLVLNPEKEWIEEHDSEIIFVVCDGICSDKPIIIPSNVLVYGHSINTGGINKILRRNKVSFKQFKINYEQAGYSDLWAYHMLLKLDMDWQAFRNEILLDHSGSEEPVEKFLGM